MGRSVNHHDVQDRMAAKFSKTVSQGPLEERDPASLSIAEQFDVEKKKRAIPKAEKIVKKEVTRFAGQNPR